MCLHANHHNTVFTTLTHIQSNGVFLNMSLYNIQLVYIIHNELPTIDERYAALIICESRAQLVPKHVVGAQLRNGVWTIRLKSEDARVHLIENMKCLNILNSNVKIHEQYPLINRMIPSEKIPFKDVPFEVNDRDLMDYVTLEPHMHVKNINIIHVRLRNRDGELTSFCSGDRFLYVRGGFRRVLPPVIDIDHQRCRILHKSQDSACKRCRYMGHCHQDTGKCDAYVNDHNIITIRSPNHVLCILCVIWTYMVSILFPVSMLPNGYLHHI